MQNIPWVTDAVDINLTYAQGQWPQFEINRSTLLQFYFSMDAKVLRFTVQLYE